MVDGKGKHIIQSLQKKWQLQSLLSFISLCLSVSILIDVIILKCIPDIFWITVIVVLIANTIIVLKTKYWQITETDVVVYLNRYYPVLEDSTEVLLKPINELPFLQQLQVKKVDSILAALAPSNPIKNRSKMSAIVLLASLLLAFILINISITKSNTPTQKLSINTNQKEIKLPQIATTIIKIIPPAYTNNPIRTQSQYNLKIEEGAIVRWQLQTAISVKNLSFIFNDSIMLPLKPADKNFTFWQLEKQLVRSGFYQVKIDGHLSELYQIDVVKDMQPIITMLTPKPNTTIDFGQPTKVNLALKITDDYGIQNASISATIASGSGEGVRFKEQIIPFAISFNQHQASYQLQQLIDLKKLQMQPGDELYFYIKALDNFKQETRSDIYIVTLPDTTQLMSFEGLANNINFKPELFRSERQIIIDAEQLLREKDTISIEIFNNRSNNLGVDQKLLRLRYGKFLGEENESNLGLEDAEKLDATEFGDGTKMIDAVTDKHDIAEDATFLDAETKKRLKAVLNEMWSTELRLRTFKPQEALPFAYKALRLLKDLQQQSRAYVAKTSFKTTPLKPEKRLSADLTKILPPLTQQQIAIKPADDLIIKQAIEVLDNLKNNSPIQSINITVLSQAAQQLSAKSTVQPSIYLHAFETIKKVIQSIQKKQVQQNIADIIMIQNALQKILVQPLATPQKLKQSTDINLSNNYFINLYKTQQ